MLRELTLERFKAFAGVEHIPIRPITLIYGPNSSGKSSIIQSLLLMKQTISEAENPDILLQPRGKLVDLGGYREFISHHNVKQNLAFSLRLLTSKWQPHPHWPEKPKTTEVGMRVIMGYSESLDAALLSSIDVFIGDKEEPVLTLRPDTKRERGQRRTSFGIGRNPPRSAAQVLTIDRANYDHPFWQEVWQIRNARYKTEADQQLRALRAQRNQLQKIIEGERIDADQSEEAAPSPRRARLEKRIKEIEEALEKYRNYTYAIAKKDFDQANKVSLLSCSNFLPTDVWFESLPIQKDHDISLFGYDPTFYMPGSMAAVSIAGEIRDFLEKIIYLGPLREYPERHYIFSGNLAEDVGKTGKMVPDVLFKDSDLLKRLNEHLDAFNFGYQIELASTGDRPELHDVFALRLLDRISRVNVSIVDVGFGISQVLPIIVQSMLSKNRTLLIEQPEIHLHPKLQSELANLFCESINPPYSNSFIVESHSEHLILRMQRLIRTGLIKSSDVSVVYVDRTPDGSRCLPIRMNENGEFIDRWPGGFFEESYSEIFA